MLLLLTVSVQAAEPVKWVGPSGTIVVNSNAPLPGVAVYVRPDDGESPFERKATSLPATIAVRKWRPAQGSTDEHDKFEVMVEAPGPDFFHTWRGSYKGAIYGGAPVTVPTHLELAWLHVLMAVSPLPVLVIVLLLWRVRRLASDTQNLSGELEAARSEAAEYASLKPGQMPKRIGPYVVRARLGTGGMATVFRVEDDYGDTYALKVPDMRMLDDPEMRQRFFREMEIGRGLHHPAIVKVYDVFSGDENTVPYIAQEFVEGETLRDLIAREAPLAEERAVEMAREAAEALAYAHGQGIVHRDIKPANIMIGKRSQVRLMDFGVAKVITLDTMTSTDTALGTPPYMAPEQLDSRTATERSDLYALGTVLFEMLSGRLPFVEEDSYRLLMRKVREEAPRLSSCGVSVSRRLENLVAMLLSANPQKRPQSAETLARMLTLLQKPG